MLSTMSPVTDDKKLATTLKRIGVTNIPAIEEVNMFKNDGEVIHFVGPKGEKALLCVQSDKCGWHGYSIGTYP